ncbi:hypothetical protein ACIBKZ_22480 [Streptomyces sp. NPDC050421]|uniref:hypothetical protein n=1 Tax=Streptomyces sp. NPDC050421 TaxID=3365613 RepID=UPI00379097D8
MTEPRVSLDDLTSDAIDQLYNDLDRLRSSRNRWAAHAGRCNDRALTAEAAIERVRAIPLEPETPTTPTTSFDYGYNQALRAARAALDQPQQPTT